MSLGNSQGPNAFESAISPLEEAAAYEALWDQDGVWFKQMAELFSKNLGARPSQFVDEERRAEYASNVLELLQASAADRVGVVVVGMLEYPVRLRDAEHPVELLYYEGKWELVNTPCVSIVGTRKPSEEGVRRARRLASALVDDGYTVVSGLAQGIDTVAHETAIAKGGRTIAVLGTPLTESYPKANAALHREIAAKHLVVSQVPVIRYGKQFYKQNRYFFPERNKTMSALSEATIIVEAGETSGTLVQARAALQQGRKLFVLDSCFESRKWPHKFVEQGAIRVKDYDQIKECLGAVVSK